MKSIEWPAEQLFSVGAEEMGKVGLGASSVTLPTPSLHKQPLHGPSEEGREQSPRHFEISHARGPLCKKSRGGEALWGCCGKEQVTQRAFFNLTIPLQCSEVSPTIREGDISIQEYRGRKQTVGQGVKITAYWVEIN